MPVRANTPICIESEVRADTTVSSSTAATFPGTDSEMTDATNTDATTADVMTPDPLVLFGSKGRELIQKMEELQYLGIDTTLPSLPKVVCIGDQSAGKSSVVSGSSFAVARSPDSAAKSSIDRGSERHQPTTQ